MGMGYRDETPLWYRGWIKGSEDAEIALRTGLITEDDLIDDPDVADEKNDRNDEVRPDLGK